LFQNDYETNLATASRRLGRSASICYNYLVNASIPIEEASKVWGPYPNYDDIARFQYGRMLWRLPDMRARLLRHWTDDRHPYKDRFLRQRDLIEEVLCSKESEEELDLRLRSRGTSLRCMTREIPPVFGSFF
jgi:hypothetical protein